MTDGIRQTFTVKRGDSAWKMAQRSLQTNGQRVTNADIMKEMRRLANLNGCNNVDDFNSKFFSKVGGDVLIKQGSTPLPEAKPETKQPAKLETPSTPKASVQKPVISSRTSQFKFPQATVIPDTIKQDTVELPDSLRIKKQSLPDTTMVQKSEQKAFETLKKQHNPTPVNPQYLKSINDMPSDEQRIIRYNKDNYQGEHYGIVDKKSCQLKIYNKEGKVVKTFTVGVGKTKGDGLGAYMIDQHYKTRDAAKAESNRYTTAGEFTLDDYAEAPLDYTGSDGKARMMNLKGDNRGVRSGQMSIHMLYDPKSDISKAKQSASYKQREAAIKSKGLEDNRMSYGCVNLTQEDYDVMHSFLGEGDKIYVLPEEQGNKLQLEKQKDGSYKFAQQYHKQDKRDLSAEQASKVKYDVRPDKDPKFVAQQKVKKAQQEKLLAQQQSQQKTSFSLFKPSTWFS